MLKFKKKNSELHRKNTIIFGWNHPFNGL